MIGGGAVSSSSNFHRREAAGGGIAAGAVAGFVAVKAGNTGLAFNWATWAVEAEGCKAADVGAGRFASGGAAGTCEATGVKAPGTEGGCHDRKKGQGWGVTKEGF